MFDFISRTTPTAGSDMTVVQSLFDSLSHARLGRPL